MQRNCLFAIAIAIAIAATAVPATATTYIGTRNFGQGSAQIMVQTDGTIGVLGSGNIINWSVHLTTPAASASFAAGSAPINLLGSGLIATPNSLDFDFSITSGEVFFSLASSSGIYCASGAGLCGSVSEAFRIYEPSVGPVYGEVVTTRRSIAFVQSGAIPEPATWAMLITGFGLVGAAARRRRPAHA